MIIFRYFEIGKRISHYLCRMDKRLLVLLIFFCLCIWNVSLASAQVQDGFTCKAPDRVSVGDTVTVRYVLDDPILACSLEYGFHEAEPEFLNLLDYYKKLLPHLSDAQTRKSDEKTIAPLLADIAWGQEWPYNSECPLVVSEGDTLHAAAGCGPVAIGRVMKYYGLSPVSGSRHGLLCK